jgi:hypothetical protein
VPAAARRHPGNQAPRERCRSAEVDLDRVVDAALVEGLKAPCCGTCGVCDQDIDLTRLLEQAAHLIAACEVGHQHPPAELLGKRRQQVGASAAQQQLRLLAREPMGDRLTDPPSRAGEQDASATQRRDRHRAPMRVGTLVTILGPCPSA